MIDRLSQRYGYEQWSGINTLGENLFIWKFSLSGNEFPGWEVYRIRPVEEVSWPPTILSLWQRPTGVTEELLRVDVFECASRIAAHDFVVQLLGEFQTTLVARQEQIAVGDVAFVVPEDKDILFARGNLVLLVRNADRALVPVTDSARQFDTDLISKPETVGVKVVPEIQRFYSPATEFRVGVNVPLEVEASDPLERPLWYKFFSSSGEVLLEEGRLIYRPASAGPQVVTVFAINANRGATSRELTLTVK
jgi:hypothetical protein